MSATNQNFFAQSEGAGTRASTNPKVTNFNPAVAAGFSDGKGIDGMGTTATITSIFVGIKRGGLKGGAIGAAINITARSAFALLSACDPFSAIRDQIAANREYDRRMADCHRLYD